LTIGIGYFHLILPDMVVYVTLRIKLIWMDPYNLSNFTVVSVAITNIWDLDLVAEVKAARRDLVVFRTYFCRDYTGRQ